MASLIEHLTSTDNTFTVDVKLLGSTRPVEFRGGFDGGTDRLWSVGQVVVGKFPTGTKLHRSSLTLWKRVQSHRPDHPLRGETAAVVNGEEYVADHTVYTHNRNNCRVVGWNDDAFPAEVIAKWRSY